MTIHKLGPLTVGQLIKALEMCSDKDLPVFFPDGEFNGSYSSVSSIKQVNEVSLGMLKGVYINDVD